MFVDLSLFSPIGSGKAIEELRASLFNELRSSEGAKRQQQRICGPSVALTFNFLVAVGIILMNKMVSTYINFLSMESGHLLPCSYQIMGL